MPYTVNDCFEKFQKKEFVKRGTNVYELKVREAI